ncbi:MAG: MBL fold metallo-hydrolase [Nitrospiraceae bacterium]|nr:MBL fold metallo-hydrolase [Nitrospiraceae bacterium]
MKTFLSLMILIFLTFSPCLVSADMCSGRGVELQVLGSGGPEVQDKRASTSYLIWIDGKARVLIDSGGGSELRFGEAGAWMKDLYLVLFTHIHVDHTAGFAALVKSSFFENRTEPLPVLGPTGNKIFPPTTGFILGLFSKEKGIYRYLSEYLTGGKYSYAIKPRNIDIGNRSITEVFSGNGIKVFALPVIHGVVPNIAYKVMAGGYTIAFTSDTNGENRHLPTLAQNSDILVAHNAVPEDAEGDERSLHMPPSVIGKIAEASKTKKLILSHRMLRTLGKEEQTMKFISDFYKGDKVFANDLDCYSLK